MSLHHGVWKSELEDLNPGSWNHLKLGYSFVWRLIGLVVAVSWDLKLGDWPELLYLVSSCGQSFLTIWWPGSEGECQRGWARQKLYLFSDVASEVTDSNKSAVLHWPGPPWTLSKFRRRQHQPQISVEEWKSQSVKRRYLCVYVCICAYIKSSLEKCNLPLLRVKEKKLPQHKAKNDVLFVIIFISDGPKNHTIQNILIKNNTWTLFSKLESPAFHFHYFYYYHLYYCFLNFSWNWPIFYWSIVDVQYCKLQVYNIVRHDF